MKKKLYIETSVWNQLEHDDRPDWNETAEKFFETLQNGIYEPYISSVVIDEIEATNDHNRQKKLIEHVNRIEPVLLEFDEDALNLLSAVGHEWYAQKVVTDCVAKSAGVPGEAR